MPFGPKPTPLAFLFRTAAACARQSLASARCTMSLTSGHSLKLAETQAVQKPATFLGSKLAKTARTLAIFGPLLVEEGAMARTVREAKITSPTARRRLKAGRQPHWHTIVAKRDHLGYQRHEGD